MLKRILDILKLLTVSNYALGFFNVCSIVNLTVQKFGD